MAVLKKYTPIALLLTRFNLYSHIRRTRNQWTLGALAVQDLGGTCGGFRIWGAPAAGSGSGGHLRRVQDLGGTCGGFRIWGAPAAGSGSGGHLRRVQDLGGTCGGFRIWGTCGGFRIWGAPAAGSGSGGHLRRVQDLGGTCGGFRIWGAPAAGSGSGGHLRRVQDLGGTCGGFRIWGAPAAGDLFGSRREGDESTCGSLCRSCFRGDQNQKMGLCPFKVPFQPDPGDADLSRLQRGYQNWQIHLVVLTPQITSKGSPNGDKINWRLLHPAFAFF